jgi:hypothetical protein
LVWIVSCLVIICVPAGILLMRGARPPSAWAYGLLIGMWLLIVAMGLLELVIPERVMTWRRWMIAGSPASYRRLGDHIDEFLGTGDPRSAGAQRNVRLVGVFLVVVGSLLTGLALLLVSLFGLPSPV